VARTRKIPLPDGSTADGEVVGFRNTGGEHWNEYLLEDGSVLKMKLVVTEVVRVEGQYDPQGNPAYMVNSTNVVAIDPADDLKKG
jgi:hypothetical protein